MKRKNESKSESNSDEKLICTICGEAFKPNDDTKYIARGGYTCSWDCFSNYVKKREKEKKEEKKEKIKK